MASTFARRIAAPALLVAIAVAVVLAAPLAAGPWSGAVALAQESGASEGEGDAEAPAADGDDGTAGTTGAEGADGEGAADEADDGLTEEEERLAEIVGADEQGASGDYEQEEDDDFVPTQEVSSDQSVNFPVDI